jgi:UDP-N-acetylglucosamine transferase subunit ALG13
MEALLEGKRIVAVPRMRKFEEALNDHQVDLCVKLSELGLITTVLDIEELERSIERALGSAPPKLAIGRLPSEILSILDGINEGIKK